MPSKTHSQKPQKDGHRNEGGPERGITGQRVLMPREYYDMKHPWFGSQIHYTIDVFRQLIRDAKASKQNSPKDAN